MIERAPSRHSPGAGLGGMAHHTGRAGSTIPGMDSLAMPLLGGIKSSFRLAVQQHGQERIRCDSVPRYAERHLANESKAVKFLRECYWRDYWCFYLVSVT